MKNIFLLVIFWLVATIAPIQTDMAPILNDTFAIKTDSLYPAEKVIYDMFDIEKAPVFPGGEKELLKFVMENIKFPTITIENVPGPMAVSFIVEADGSISNKKVLKGVEFAQILIDMLNRMPRWTPGMKDGKPVAVQFTLPIRIKWE